jgi:hypothetical protein
MNGLVRVAISVAVTGVVVACSSPAYAAKGSGGSTYNCKSDKVVDVPIQFVVDVQSAARIHMSAYGGSDKSGLIYPTVWNLYDSTAKLVDYFPKALVVWTSSNMYKEANLEGLVPGASYVVELVSQDSCNNRGTVRRSVTLPVAAPESSVPVLSVPSLVQVGLIGSFTEVTFSATDDTGLVDVIVYINGTAIQHFIYDNAVTYRWWFDNYPFDNTQSTLEGPNYYISYADEYKGQTALVEVVAVDVYGNRSVTSAVLGL